jgi:hypothetical protein
MFVFRLEETVQGWVVQGRARHAAYISLLAFSVRFRVLSSVLIASVLSSESYTARKSVCIIMFPSVPMVATCRKRFIRQSLLKKGRVSPVVSSSASGEISLVVRTSVRVAEVFPAHCRIRSHLVGYYACGHACERIAWDIPREISYDLLTVLGVFVDKGRGGAALQDALPRIAWAGNAQTVPSAACWRWQATILLSSSHLPDWILWHGLINKHTRTTKTAKNGMIIVNIIPLVQQQVTEDYAITIAIAKL